MPAFQVLLDEHDKVIGTAQLDLDHNGPAPRAILRPRHGQRLVEVTLESDVVNGDAMDLHAAITKAIA
jgi:hypothetical protein